MKAMPTLLKLGPYRLKKKKNPKSKIGHEITSKEQYYLSFAHNLIVRCITYIPCGGVHSISSCCYKETNCDVQIDFFLVELTFRNTTQTKIDELSIIQIVIQIFINHDVDIDPPQKKKKKKKC